MANGLKGHLISTQSSQNPANRLNHEKRGDNAHAATAYQRVLCQEAIPEYRMHTLKRDSMIV